MQHLTFKTGLTLARRSILGLLVMAAALPHQGMAQLSLSPSKALATTWTGFADTDLEFSEFLSGDHTIAFRFMSQYPYAYEGPMLAENGRGTFIIGQGDYKTSTPGKKLLIQVGSQSQLHLVLDLQPGEWHHVAVVGTTEGTLRKFTTYLDGVMLGGPMLVPVNDPELPSGTLRFGKRTTRKTVNDRNAQFYGLLDDVAIFTRALDQTAIQKLAAKSTKLTGSEFRLVAGYTFDSGAQPFRLSRPVKLQGKAEIAQVTSNHNEVLDRTAFAFYTPKQEMTLPFKAGEAWYVIQGYDNGGYKPDGTLKGSHNGYAAFCWDFKVAGHAQTDVYPFGTKYAPFYASVPGLVVSLFKDYVSGKGNDPNRIETQVAKGDGEVTSYLHFWPDTNQVIKNNAVLRGQLLALAGDTGVDVGAHHLHFGVKDLPDGTTGAVTYPVVISNYEVRDENGAWHKVSKGIPQAGQVIRRPMQD